MSLLLLERSLADLRMGEHTNDGAIAADALKLTRRILAILGCLFGILGKGLLLRFVPIFIESALDLIAKMASPDGGKGSQATRGFDVADQADNDDLKYQNDSMPMPSMTRDLPEEFQ